MCVHICTGCISVQLTVGGGGGLFTQVSLYRPGSVYVNPDVCMCVHVHVVRLCLCELFLCDRVDLWSI